MTYYFQTNENGVSIDKSERVAMEFKNLNIASEEARKIRDANRCDVKISYTVGDEQHTIIFEDKKV